MQVFLVGGAVRDILMGVTPKDKDYVMVGYSKAEVIEMGMMPVGADFPVFLHPYTGDEYALARREKKTGTGYLGFTSEFGVDVTLEDDLARRDLTINSMAIPETVGPVDTLSVLIDPFNGLSDIKNKVLRHTSNAFAEDPVRVLRLARFRARFGPDWTVAPETTALVHDMAKKGVLNELTAERVWKELSRALMEPFPRLFFDTLLELDALHVLFPEVYKLKTALEARKWHPEGDAYEHVQLVLEQAVKNDYDLETRIMCLVHDFGKGATHRDLLPRHYGHDVKGVPLARDFLKRLAAPTSFIKHAEKVTQYHMAGHRLSQMNAKTFVKMFDDMGILNDPESVELLYRTFQCDARGRLGSEKDDISHLDIFLDIADAYKSVKFADVFPSGGPTGAGAGDKIKNAMHRARVAAVGKVMS